MAAPEKRRPGQSNEQHSGRSDPNAAFIGTGSVVGGGDPSWVLRAFRALTRRRDRRKGKTS